jgi:TP901 family phage tail tape measure protein
MPNTENVTTKFRVDISDLKKNITAANNAVKQYRAELKNADAGMEKGEKTVDSLSRKIEAQSKIVEQEQAKLDALKDELKRYEETVQKGEGIIADLTEKHKQAAKQFGENSEEARKLAAQLRDAETAQERNVKKADDLRTAIINQDTALKNAQHQVQVYTDDLDELQSEEKEVGDEAEKTTDGGLSAFGVALGNLAAGAITAVIDKLGELAAAAVKAFESFDEGRDNLIKATGAVGEQADALTAAYSKTAKSVVGDLDSIGSAVGEVNTRFGFTGDKLSSVTEDFVKFADITGTDATQAVRLVARAMGDAGIDADNYSELLDQLAIAAQASGISVDTLTESLTKYGAPMRALGFDTAESIALFSSWEKAGVNTETAFSGMRKAISNWSKDGKDAREEFKKTIDEIASLPDIASATTKAIEIFGAKAGPDLADAIQGGRFEYGEFLNVLGDSAGTVKKTYEETQSGIDKITLATQRLSVTLGEAAGTLVDKFAPQIEHIIDLFGDVLNGTSGAPERLASAITGILSDALKIVVDKLPDVVSLLVSLINSLSEKLIEMTPQLVETAGEIITTLIRALSKLLPKLAEKIVDTLPKLVDALMQAIPEIINALIEFANAIVKKLPVIIKKIAAELPAMVQTIADTITEQLPVVLQAAIDIFNALVEAIPEVLPTLVDALPQLIDTIINFLVDNSKTLVEANVKALSAIIDAIPIVIEALAPQIPRIVDAVVHGVLDNSDKILDAVVSIGESIIGLGADFITNLPEWLGKIWAPINEFLIQPAKQGFKELFEYFGTFDINEKISDVLLECGETVSKFFKFLRGKYDTLIDFLSEIPDNFFDFFELAWKKVKGVFANVGEFFGGIFDEVIGKFKDVGVKVGEAIGSTFKKAINAVLATVENAINTVPEAINGAIDLLNELPGVDIGPLDRIELPRLAKGGVIDKSTLAVLGENGREAILPLEKNKAGLKEIADLLAGEMLGGSAASRGGGQSVTNTYTFTQTNNSPKALSRWDIYRDTKNLIKNLKMEGVVT